MMRVSYTNPPKQPLVYFQGSYQPSRLKFKVIVFTNIRDPCYSTIPRRHIAPLHPFRPLHHLLPPHPGVLPPSLMWSRPPDQRRMMTTKFHMSSHLGPIQRKSRIYRMPLSSDKRFYLRKSTDSVSSTFTSGYLKCTRTISERTRSG